MIPVTRIVTDLGPDEEGVTFNERPQTSLGDAEVKVKGGVQATDLTTSEASPETIWDERALTGLPDVFWMGRTLMTDDPTSTSPRSYAPLTRTLGSVIDDENPNPDPGVDAENPSITVGVATPLVET
jgi:hypothetical protein